VTQVVRNQDVIWDRVDGLLVLCHTGTGEFFRLNETGAFIWELCEQQTLEEIIKDIQRKYPAESFAHISAAVNEYILALRVQDLLRKS